MTTLNAVLKEILESRGFLVDQAGSFVRGRREKIELHFFPYSRHSPAAMEELIKAAPGIEGKVVLAALVPLAESTLAALPPEVVVWDREAVEHEVGRTRIEKLVGEEDHGLIDDLYADDVPMLDGPPEQGEEERIIPMRISLQDVVELSSRSVGGFSHRLELVPHYLFSYQVPLYVGEGKIGGREGNMAINALTKDVQSWDQVPETVANLDQGHKRLEPILEEEDASALVRSTVEKEHTYERDMVRENGQVTMTERVTVHPRMDLGSVRSLGIYYVPIWCVEGTKGVMVLNASTGKVLSEDYFRDIS
ncbi:MAG: hypothetical protein KBA58_00535 [Methanomassiliicoccales archaeon]|jgi:hypothetical protein|nr:hypothetical protein [Methanomassiliicoccales archaeon]